VPLIHVTDRAGRDYSVDAAIGTPLMEVLRERGDVEAICGGSAACATCHVHVDEAWTERVGPAGPDETNLLEYSLERRPTSRLSCQVEVRADFDGLKVRIAASEG
jgi:2Fe-2S ferredoxin